VDDVEERVYAFASSIIAASGGEVGAEQAIDVAIEFVTLVMRMEKAAIEQGLWDR
jgi:hypothetical protein